MRILAVPGLLNLFSGGLRTLGREDGAQSSQLNYLATKIDMCATEVRVDLRARGLGAALAVVDALAPPEALEPPGDVGAGSGQ